MNVTENRVKYYDKHDNSWRFAKTKQLANFVKFPLIEISS